MTTKRILFIASIGASALLAGPAAIFAQAEHPNFTGTWVMDAAKSEQSPLTPDVMTYVVQQKGDQIVADRHVKTANGESDAHLVFAIDGKPWKNEWTQGAMNVVGRSTLSWEGSTLIIKTAITADGQAIDQVDRWTLGPDGKSVVVQRSIEAGGQTLSAKVVMTKAS